MISIPIEVSTGREPGGSGGAGFLIGTGICIGICAGISVGIFARISVGIGPGAQA